MSHLERLDKETDFAAQEITRAWLELAYYDAGQAFIDKERKYE